MRNKNESFDQTELYNWYIFCGNKNIVKLIIALYNFIEGIIVIVNKYKSL